jgi:RRXRR protein
MRIPVVDGRGVPLMPCTPPKARALLKSGKARPKRNKLGLFYLQLIYDREKQRLSLHAYQTNKRLTQNAKPTDCHRLTAIAFRCWLAPLKQTNRIVTEKGAALPTPALHAWVSAPNF